MQKELVAQQQQMLLLSLFFKVFIRRSKEDEHMYVTHVVKKTKSWCPCSYALRRIHFIHT